MTQINNYIQKFTRYQVLIEIEFHIFIELASSEKQIILKMKNFSFFYKLKQILYLLFYYLIVLLVRFV